ncbi:hypothetical protein TVAG_482390 [Trichomonas vaginalis G3]|uniref:Uncharacterized protein n=1 Tax=Trichomonas vaginalis (strain ATCC PRA-98 / G3) TaxID=412133 RepID=A2EBP8_TRIV3|nr:armadillo (ARM) repeat-containing protein family [Trichomonas vaginalis G3]EAY09965.1 hypothetical protein TVAG_482390 [Trichomonas vaginalis G3]KAI5523121.1 armadillo (ARM) repeat-containing protein family [Trichomonas vaginalis G3]|eukprot:XP_001322188.1 hypothetical protein [Trichomonas vaginalis G3]
MNELKSKLIDEIHRYSSYNVKGEIKRLITSFINQLNQNQIRLPIHQHDSPLFKILNTMSSDANFLKTQESYITLLCNLISNDFFTGKCKSNALIALETACLRSSQNNGLKIIQFSATILPTLAFDPDCVAALFSISLSMILHTIPIVSTTAFATSQQMVSIIFDLYYNKDNKIPNDVLKTLNTLVPAEFTHPMLKISFLLLNDICNLLEGQESKWIRVKGLSEGVLVSLWNIIISSHYNFIISEKPLLELVERSVPIPIKSFSKLPLYVSFMSKYYKENPEKTIEMFNYFESTVDTDKNYLYFFRSVFLSSKNYSSDFTKSIDNNISMTNRLLNKLLIIPSSQISPTILNFSLNQTKEMKQQNFELISSIEIALSFILFGNPYFISYNRKELMLFIVYCLRYSNLDFALFCFEGIAKFLNVLHENKNEEERLELIRIITNFVAKQRVLRENAMPAECLSCDLLHTQKKGFFFKQKRILGFKMLIALFNNKISIFERCYTRLFFALSSFPRNKEMEIETTKKIETKELRKIISVLGKNDMFFIDLLQNILIQNNDRIEQVWSNEIFDIPNQKSVKYSDSKTTIVMSEMPPRSISPKQGKNEAFSKQKGKKIPKPPPLENTKQFEEIKVRKERRKSDSIQNDRENFLQRKRSESTKTAPTMRYQRRKSDAASSSVYPETENQQSTTHKTDNIKSVVINMILKTLESCDNKNRLFTIKTVISVLISDNFNDCSEISELFKLINRKILAPPMPSVEEEEFLIKLFLPKYCHDKNSINSCFEGLSFVIKSLLNSVPDRLLPQIIESLFLFVGQRIDQNVSLKSFELLWILAPRVKKNESLVSSLVSQCFYSLADDRKEVADIAVESCFSLFSSNANEINDATFETFMNGCFIPLLSSSSEFSNAEVYQKLFWNILKCVIQFYDRFTNIKSFNDEFWFLLFEKHLEFMKKCQKGDIREKSIDFYKESFNFQKFDEEVYKNLQKTFNEFVKTVADEEMNDINLMKTICDQFCQIYSSAKVTQTEIWLSTISFICQSIPNDFTDFSIPSSLFKLILDAVNPETVLTVSLFVKEIIVNAKSDKIRENGFDILKEIIEKTNCELIITLSQVVIPVFEFEQSFEITKIIFEKISAKNNYTQSEADNLFNIISHFMYCDKETVHQKIVDLFSSVSNSKKVNFVRMSKDDKVLMKLWSIYFDPKGTKYDRNMFDLCFTSLFDNLFNLVSNDMKDDQRLIDFLSFIEKANVPKMKLGFKNDSTTWHLVNILSWLFNLIDDERSEVAKLSKEVISHVTDDMDGIIKN